MDRLHKLAAHVVDAGGHKSASFKSFATKFRNDWKKELAKVGAELTAWTTGHYYVSGFFRTQDGQCWYFSISDVRYFGFGKMLYRKAKDEKDFMGEANQYVNIETDMVHNMKLISQRWKAQIGATNENVWSENAMSYDTQEEVKQWLDGLSTRWFGYWCSRIVPEDTPNREPIDQNDPAIYQWFKR